MVFFSLFLVEVILLWFGLACLLLAKCFIFFGDNFSFFLLDGFLKRGNFLVTPKCNMFLFLQFDLVWNDFSVLTKYF